MKQSKTIGIYTFKNLIKEDSASKVINANIRELSNSYEVCTIDSSSTLSITNKQEIIQKHYPKYILKYFKIINILIDKILQALIYRIPKNEIGYLSLVFNFHAFLKLLHASKKHKISVIYSFFPHTIPSAYLVSKIRQTKLVFGSHNLEHSRIRREYGNSFGVKCILMLEKFCFYASDNITTVSDSDTNVFFEICENTDKIFTIPNSLPASTKESVNLDKVRLIKKKYNREENLLLVMHSDWNFKPNKASLAAFFSRIYRKLYLNYPQMKFLILGRLDTQIKLPNVIQLGWVDNLYEHLSLADIAVLPQVRGGGGTRNKLVDYLSLGIPTVTTLLGSEGIDLIDGKHAFICKDIDDNFVEKILKLLKSDSLKNKFKKESELFFHENLTTERAVDNLTNIFL